jgi:hypothetical protein
MLHYKWDLTLNGNMFVEPYSKCEKILRKMPTSSPLSPLPLLNPSGNVTKKNLCF